MYIETQRLIIDDITLSDEQALIDMASDGSLARDVGFTADCRDWMRAWINENAGSVETDDPRGSDSIGYMIRLKDGTAVGSVGCTLYEDTGRIGVVYFIGSQYRGSSYAAEAAEAYARYFLGHYNEDELAACIREANIPSWKTAEKAGFALTERKMYKDIYDDAEEMYRFYAYRRGE